MNPKGATVTLGSREVASRSKPYLIAEIGVNHEGDFERAKELIRLAKAGGADAAKFQTYKAEKITIPESPAYWDLNSESTTSQFELFKKYDAFDEQHYVELARYSGEIGIDFLSTPFDLDAVGFLDPLCPFFKIASADLTNVPLLRAVARCGKPVVLSTGASNLGEIAEAVETLDAGGASDVVLMQCTLNYPCDYADANLAMIRDLARVFPDRIIGYSDHTRPNAEMSSLTSAWLLGAVVLEKHFTFDKTLPGNDHYHAMDAADGLRFREKCEFIHGMLGSPFKHSLLEEIPARNNARRSVVTARPLQPGQTITEADLTTLRPGTGIPAIHWDSIVGRIAARAIAANQLLKWGDISA